MRPDPFRLPSCPTQLCSRCRQRDHTHTGYTASTTRGALEYTLKIKEGISVEHQTSAFPNLNMSGRAVADPGFSWWGGTEPTPKVGVLTYFLPKIARKWKNLNPQRGAFLASPLDQPMQGVPCIIRPNWTSSTFIIVLLHKKYHSGQTLCCN